MCLAQGHNAVPPVRLEPNTIFNLASIHALINAHNIFMPPKELWEAYSNRTVRPSVRQSVRPTSCPVHISYIL